jgi:hypothetical protein
MAVVKAVTSESGSSGVAAEDIVFKFCKMKLNGDRKTHRRSVENLRGLGDSFEVCLLSTVHRLLEILTH